MVPLLSAPFCHLLQSNVYLAAFAVMMAANRGFLDVGTSASTHGEGIKGEAAN